MFSGSNLVLSLYCALVVAPAFSSGQETKDSRIVQELLKVNEEMMAAEVRGDIPALDKLFADAYIHFHESARVQHKSDFLDDFKTGQRKYLAAKIAEAQVHVFGTSAVINGIEYLKQAHGDTQHGFTAVWVQAEGKWRLAAWIARPVPKSAK